jgi:hypothetical protein
MTDLQVDYQLKIRFIFCLDPRLQRFVRPTNQTKVKDAITSSSRDSHNRVKYELT